MELSPRQKNRKETKMRSAKLTLSLSVLALGTALSALPALAQDSHYPVGRNLDDGGFSTLQNDSKTGQIAPRAPKTAQNQNMTGLGLYNYSGQGAAPAQEYKYPLGRNLNDGGISTAQFDKGAQRTGSNSNREAFRSGTESYSAGGQGQRPQTAPNAYGYTR
jgi:hypothetical protein